MVIEYHLKSIRRSQTRSQNKPAEKQKVMIKLKFIITFIFAILLTGN